MTLAGLKKLAKTGRIQAQESVVLVLTGHTLKDAEYTIAYHRGELLRPEELGSYTAELESSRRPATVLDPSVSAVLQALAIDKA